MEEVEDYRKQLGAVPRRAYEKSRRAMEINEQWAQASAEERDTLWRQFLQAVQGFKLELAVEDSLRQTIRLLHICSISPSEPAGMIPTTFEPFTIGFPKRRRTVFCVSWPASSSPMLRERRDMRWETVPAISNGARRRAVRSGCRTTRNLSCCSTFGHHGAGRV